MRQTADLRKTSMGSQPKKMNGHSDHIFGQAMEIDDPVEGDWDRMDTEEMESGARYSGKLQETLAYGQALQAEFGDRQNKEVKDSLNAIFAMFAYEDLWKSPTAHLLEQSGRVLVAEELNSAILGTSIQFHVMACEDFNYTSITWQVSFRRVRASMPANRDSYQRHQRRRRRRGFY